jgi:hypothetical protein
MTSVISDIMHSILNELRIISKIREGQKLNTINGLSIYTESIFGWVMRKVHGDSKEESIKHIRELYKSLSQMIDLIILEPKKTTITILITAGIELKNSIVGLDNLAKTYALFPTTLAAIEGILRDYILNTYNTILNNIPEEQYPKEFNTSIVFQNTIIRKGKDIVGDDSKSLDLSSKVLDLSSKSSNTSDKIITDMPSSINPGVKRSDGNIPLVDNPTIISGFKRSDCNIPLDKKSK